MPRTSFLTPGKARGAGRPAPLKTLDVDPLPVRFPTAKSLYVRKTGSDNNGGDSSGTSPTVTGADGVVDGTRSFTAASGAFDASYVDRLINIVGVGRFRIEAVLNATTLTLSALTLPFIDDQYSGATDETLVGSSGVGNISGQMFYALGIYGNDRTLAYVDVMVAKVGAPVDNLVLQIRDHIVGPSGVGIPGSSVLASKAISGASLSSSTTSARITLDTPQALTAGTRYWVALTRSGAADAGNFYTWARRNPINELARSGDGATWAIEVYGGRIRYGFVNAGALTWNIGGAVQTIDALLGNGNDAVREGDSAYIGAGTYREAIVMEAAPKHGVLTLSIIGDVDGSQTGDSGEVQVTAHATNDETAANLTPAPLELAARSLLDFSKMVFVNPRAKALNAPAGSSRVTFTDCAFFGSVLAATAYSFPLRFTWDRCRFVYVVPSQGDLLAIQLTGGGGSDYDAETLIKNSLLLNLGGANTVHPAPASAVGQTGKGGGVVVRNCTLIGGGGSGGGGSQNGMNVSLGSLIFPSAIYNSIILIGGSGTGLIAQTTLGQIVEDYNLIYASTVRNNVTAGANSISDMSSAPLFHYGQEDIWGAALRLFGEPTAGSPLLGFGSDGLGSAYDLRGNPSPAGGASALKAIGALERGNTFARETGTVHTGSNAISAVGPAYQDFLVAVNSGTSYTFSIYVKYDSSYTGTLPQLSALDGAEAGVNDETVTATALPSYTPVQNGGDSLDTSGARLAQKFVPTTDIDVSQITIQTNKSGAPTDNVILDIRADSAGQPSATVLGTSTVAATSIASGVALTAFALAANAVLSAGTSYWIVARRSGATDGANFVNWRIILTSGYAYPGAQSGDSGGSWTPVTEGFYFVLAGWAKIALTLFAPTSSGFVTVRVQSNDTSGSSEVVFDSFAVA